MSDSTSDDSQGLGETIPTVTVATNNDGLSKEDSVIGPQPPLDGNQGDNKDEEDDEVEVAAYRLRVYGITANSMEDETTTIDGKHPTVMTRSSFRRASERISQEFVRRRSSITEQLPETPAGWTILLSCLFTIGLGYEIQLQKSLTQPPYTFGQLAKGSMMRSVYEKMTATPESILSRPIQPSLLVGTRGILSSTAAYLFGGPSSLKEEHLRFREIITSTVDGATIGIDWEVPWRVKNTRTFQLTEEERKEEILHGPIQEPVVIIMHGINNDSSFGYMKSLQRSFANRGWNAAAMNFRGCGGVPMTTPRGYNAANTNDLRCLIWRLSGRLSADVPIFLVGNSLGANIMTKYLGEEGMSGTLPKCVSAAASLGNPLSINSSLVSFPFNIAMALGVKKTFMRNLSVFSKMTDTLSKQALRNALLSPTISQLDMAMAPVLIRSAPFYPFAFRIGYKSGNSYWLDSSSYRLIRYISIPYLNLTANDDFLVAAPNRNRLGFCISNPNVLVAETRCGGHLGWQESPPDSRFGSTSWADSAASDFFDAVMKTNMEGCGSPVTPHRQDNPNDNTVLLPATAAARKDLKEKADEFRNQHLKSRL